MHIYRFVLLLALSALGHKASVQADVMPPARSYELWVTTANGEAFRDCATFSGDHALVLQAGRDLIIDWLMESSDPSGRKFQAVSNGSRASSNPFGLAMHGSFGGADAISGDAINDRGLTFTFSGRLNRACTLDSTPPEGRPYSKPPARHVLFEPQVGSVAGLLYGVELYGAEVTYDCFSFAIDGALIRNAGATLTWGMDRRNDGVGTFQAVGKNASAGLALRGELASWGELRVHGISSSTTGRREIVGSAHVVGGCVAD
jgi:hypothetical protein